MSHRSFIRRILCAVLLAVSALFAVIGCQQEQTEPPTASASGSASQETTQEEATMSRTESAETTTTATETVTETVTESETDAPTEAPTEPTTEPETDPVREALERSVSVVPYIPAEPSRLRDVKAMWLSQFDLNKVYTNGGRQRAEDDFRNRIAGILQNVADNGFNTVIVQVRPNADSFYPSDLYAPSAYVTGSYANDFTYDPFSILIEEARARGLSVHAWINPLRGVTTSELQKMDMAYALRQWYEDTALRGQYIVEYNGRWYLNPAYAEVRDLIVYGAREILQRYDVDGIHMDDYFYPTQDASFDADAYAAYRQRAVPCRRKTGGGRTCPILYPDCTA